LTAKERRILDLYPDFECVATKEFAIALGYSYSQAQNKMSYIKKKIKNYANKLQEFFLYN
jgi:hypothetical protein